LLSLSKYAEVLPELLPELAEVSKAIATTATTAFDTSASSVQASSGSDSWYIHFWKSP
jgi:hypothetical protein